MAGIDEGLLPGLGTEDGNYARQRRDEIAIRLADLRGRAEQIVAKRTGMLQEEQSLRIETRLFDRFQPDLPPGSVIWSPSPAQGVPVALGDKVLELLDCSRRFVEVFVPETAFESIHPGDTASVQLRGSNVTFSATVEAVHGAGTLMSLSRLAAQPEKTSDGSLSVMLRIEPADVTQDGVARRFCDVGRTAEVRFDRGLGHRLAMSDTWVSSLIRRVLPSYGAPEIAQGSAQDAG